MLKNFVVATFIGFWAQGAALGAYQIKNSDSLFAIVTQKEGVASGLAHDHLIVASQYDANLNLEGENIASGTFEIKIPVSGLVVDAPEMQQKWTPKIQELSVHKENFAALSESDRKKITDNMLDKSQLNAQQFPSIQAKIVSLKKAEGELVTAHKGGSKATSANYSAEVSFEIKGKTVVKTVPAKVQLTGSELKVTTVVPLSFTEFGIKPYSALLGAIRNGNNFHLVVDFVAEKK
jgi:YceI-like domain